MRIICSRLDRSVPVKKCVMTSRYRSQFAPITFLNSVMRLSTSILLGSDEDGDNPPFATACDDPLIGGTGVLGFVLGAGEACTRAIVCGGLIVMNEIYGVDERKLWEERKKLGKKRPVGKSPCPLHTTLRALTKKDFPK